MTWQQSEKVPSALAAASLRNALPYLCLYQGRLFVIKAGGEAFVSEQAMRSLLEQVSILHRLGIRIVLVHGGGPQIDTLCRSLDLELKKERGRRITDSATLEATVMALCGTVNTKIVAALKALGCHAVGLSGVDGSLLGADRRPPHDTTNGEALDYGWVGDLNSVRGDLLESLHEQGYLPVVSPLAATEEGQLLNVNADTVAATLARALGAEKLLLLTAAQGILEDPDDPASLVSYTDLAGLEQLEQEGALEGGMRPKAAAIRIALEGGVPRVHVLSHNVRDSLLVEIFTNEGSGSLVVRDCNPTH